MFFTFCLFIAAQVLTQDTGTGTSTGSGTDGSGTDTSDTDTTGTGTPLPPAAPTPAPPTGTAPPPTPIPPTKSTQRPTPIPPTFSSTVTRSSTTSNFTNTNRSSSSTSSNTLTTRPTTRTTVLPTTPGPTCANFGSCVACVDPISHPPSDKCAWCGVCVNENACGNSTRITDRTECSPPSQGTTAPPPTSTTTTTTSTRSTTTSTASASTTQTTSAAASPSCLRSFPFKPTLCALSTNYVAQFDQQCLAVNNGTRTAALPASTNSEPCDMAARVDLQSTNCSRAFSKLACSVGCQPCVDGALLLFPGRLVCRSVCEQLLAQSCPTIARMCMPGQGLRALCHSSDQNCITMPFDIVVGIETIFAPPLTPPLAVTTPTSQPSHMVTTTEMSAFALTSQEYFVPAVAGGAAALIVIIVVVVIVVLARRRRRRDADHSPIGTTDSTRSTTNHNTGDYGDVALALRPDPTYDAGEALMRANKASSSSSSDTLTSLGSNRASVSASNNAGGTTIGTIGSVGVASAPSSSHYSSPNVLAASSANVDHGRVGTQYEDFSGIASTTSATTNYQPIQGVGGSQ